MKTAIVLLMLLISILCPIVTVVARKELSDWAKAFMIMYGMSMMIVAMIYGMAW